CLSVIGIAREVAAITGKSLRLPEVRIVEGDGSASELLSVRVEDPVLCPRFVARVITGVTVGPSPEWMVARLQAAGVRAINNVVDVTNYVMLEYGQPMHPYDAALLPGHALVVRRAREGETLQTLDGQTRLLTPQMLVIADGAGTPIGLAGIMGGEGTEVSEATTTVALEVANWNPANIRRTSTRLGLRTEASTRFEKGLPAYLTALAADLVEEIARMIGYDKVPETMLRGGVPAHEVDRGLYWWRRLRPFLLACGLSEATNHSLTGDTQLARLRAPHAVEAGPLSEDEIAALVPNAAAVTAAGAIYGPLRVQNPMAPDRDTLRPTLMAGLLDNLSLNLRNGAESVRFFELGRAYFPHVFQAPDPARLPALERRTLGIALAGLREERSWDGPTVTLDFFDLKGIVEELMAYCGVATYVVEPAGHPVLHPGRPARLRPADGRR